MKPKIERGKRGSFWSTRLSSDLSLLRRSDKNIVLITILALIPCISLCYYMAGTGNYNVYDMVPVLTLPLFLDGMIIYISERRWKSFALLVVVMTVLATVHYLEYVILTPTTLFFFLFILIGT